MTVPLLPAFPACQPVSLKLMTRAHRLHIRQARRPTQRMTQRVQEHRDSRRSPHASEARRISTDRTRSHTHAHAPGRQTKERTGARLSLDVGRRRRQIAPMPSPMISLRIPPPTIARIRAQARGSFAGELLRLLDVAFEVEDRADHPIAAQPAPTSRRGFSSGMWG